MIAFYLSTKENTRDKSYFWASIAMKKEKLVIIPTFNEIENIRDIATAVMALDGEFDLLVIDDGSPDGTAAEVKNLQGEFPDRIYLIQRNGKLGLGTAYIAGFRFALDHGYAYVFEMDADFSHNPADLSRLYQTAAVGGYDLVVGSRYISGVNVVNWPMSRVLMSFFASKYVQFITGMPIKDATAGFKCYKSRVLAAMDLDKIRFIGYAFQIEMKFTTWKLGFRIKEIPIIFTDRTKGTSKMNTRIFREAFIGVINMKIKSWFRKYPAISQT